MTKSAQEVESRRCLCCQNEILGTRLNESTLLPYFEDLCICSECLEREKGGAHAKR